MSLFTYKDVNIRAYARALWLTNMLLVIFILDIILFSKDVITFETSYTYEAIIGAILGILLIPGSLMVRLLAKLAAPIHSRDERE